MSHQPTIIAIDDMPYSYQSLKNLKEEAPRKYRVDLEISRPVIAEDSVLPLDPPGIPFMKMKEYLESPAVPRSVILLLDLNIPLNEGFHWAVNYITNTLKYDRKKIDFEPPEICVGLGLALLALNNTKIESLLIFSISTKLNGPIKEIIQKACDNFKEANRGYKRVLSSHQGLTIDLGTTKLALDNALNDWNKYIPSGPSPYVQAIQDLFKHTLKFPNVKDPGHPEGSYYLPSEDFAIGSVLLSNFQESDFDQNFKALFAYLGCPTNPEGKLEYWDSRRRLDVKIFEKLLNESGIEVDRSEFFSKRIRLPLCPGILFFIHLRSFLFSLEEQEPFFRLYGKEDKPEIRFLLNNLERFESAIYQRSGHSAKRFKDLLFCEKAIIEKEMDRPEWQDLWESWPPFPTLETRSQQNPDPRYRKILRFSFSYTGSDNYLSIKW